ncbi:helix-turn-helix transcriptional regulator [Nocardia sp. CNY236]|uniref:helix-turn-helix domain-containing protein n=1 Tax=Nocardia sp. CNY236 TaxID=1169152 RepID=UPI0009DD9FDA|nr:helix-turn-helix transcriptional regulator [Nocardia sp. CNY236]
MGTAECNDEGDDVARDSELEETGSTLPRRQLGRYLREAREGAGLSTDKAAQLMEWHKSTVNRLERGLTERIRVRDILGLCEIYGLSDEKTAVAKGLAEQTPAKSWWHAYADLIPANVNLFVGLESGANTLTMFQPLVVPGLLQTANYARALDRIYFPDETSEELDRRVALRIRRQNILTRKRRPTRAVIVLHENVLRTVIGDRRVMAALLRHIADLGTRDNIEVRLLPFRAGLPLGMPLPPFTVFEFDRDTHGRLVEPTVVFSESFAGAMYFERRTEVELYRRSFEIVQSSALDTRPSRDMLRQIAREYDSER